MGLSLEGLFLGVFSWQRIIVVIVGVAVMISFRAESFLASAKIRGGSGGLEN